MPREDFTPADPRAAMVGSDLDELRETGDKIDSLDKMQRVAEWPLGSILPVKRVLVGDAEHLMDFGHLRYRRRGDRREVLSCVFDNDYEHKYGEQGLIEGTYKHYESLQALVDDGWRVD